MMRRTMMAMGFGVVLLLAACVWADEPKAPRLFQSDGTALAHVKEKIAAGDTQDMAALTSIVMKANKDLIAKPFTIVNKPKAPADGDKHDYVSLAPYWWPDPDKADGLPYIRKDGQSNPERAKYDQPLLVKMTGAVRTLCLAYYLTGDEKYAVQAAKLLRVWFLDKETYMKPNMNHAQFVPGQNDGRGTGLIEGRAFAQIVDAVQLLQESKAWTKDDDKALKQWMGEFIKWMRESKCGKEEAAAKNNHGTFCDATLVTLALYVGDKELAKKVLEESKTKRIAAQIQPDGSLPLELARTKSYGYSQFDLEAFFALATLGDRVGVDLWNYETKDGRGIRKALDWLTPYATGDKKWTNKQLGRLSPAGMVPLLRRAAIAYKDKKYDELAAKVTDQNEGAMSQLLYPAGK
jgi:hypothetical protein